MATLVSCAIGRLFTTSRVEQAGSVPKLAGIGPVTQVNFQGIQTVSKMPGQVASLTLKFAKLSKNAYAPTKGSPSAAGFDLYR